MDWDFPRPALVPIRQCRGRAGDPSAASDLAFVPINWHHIAQCDLGWTSASGRSTEPSSTKPWPIAPSRPIERAAPSRSWWSVLGARRAASSPSLASRLPWRRGPTSVVGLEREDLRWSVRSGKWWSPVEARRARSRPSSCSRPRRELRRGRAHRPRIACRRNPTNPGNRPRDIALACSPGLERRRQASDSPRRGGPCRGRRSRNTRCSRG